MTSFLSKFNLNKDQNSSANTGLYGQARVAFIRKVYSVVSIQLAFTALLCWATIYSASFTKFAITSNWLSILSAIACIISQLVIMMGKPSNKVSLGCLTVFTLGQSYLVARACASVAWVFRNGKLHLSDERAAIVGQAAILTVLLVTFITLYAFYTKKDYTMGSAIFSMVCSSFMFLGLILMFSRNSFIHSVYLWVGLVIFGVYLIIDTQRIVGGKRMQLKTDQYIIGAMLIYADIIVIFLKILALLAKNEKKKD